MDYVETNVSFIYKLYIAAVQISVVIYQSSHRPVLILILVKKNATSVADILTELIVGTPSIIFWFQAECSMQHWALHLPHWVMNQCTLKRTEVAILCKSWLKNNNLYKQMGWCEIASAMHLHATHHYNYHLKCQPCKLACVDNCNICSERV